MPDDLSNYKIRQNKIQKKKFLPPPSKKYLLVMTYVIPTLLCLLELTNICWLSFSTEEDLIKVKAKCAFTKTAANLFTGIKKGCLLLSMNVILTFGCSLYRHITRLSTDTKNE